MVKYFMKIREIKTGREWEEEMTSMFVTEKSPHYSTHESGMHHDIPKNLTEEQVQHYAENLMLFFNRRLRAGESPRELVSYRIAK